MTDTNHIEAELRHVHAEGRMGRTPDFAAIAANITALSARASAGEGGGGLTASEALHGFAGWLTSLVNPVTFSAQHWASPAAEMVGEYCAAAGLAEPREDFHERIPSMPASRAFKPLTAAPQPAQAGAVVLVPRKHGPALPLRGKLVRDGGETWGHVEPEATPASPATGDHIADADKMVTPPAHGDGEGNIAEAWAKVCIALNEVDPNWMDHERGIEWDATVAAVNAIRRLATTRPTPEARDAARLDFITAVPGQFSTVPQKTSAGNYVIHMQGLGYFHGATAREAIDAAQALPAQGEGK